MGNFSSSMQQQQRYRAFHLVRKLIVKVMSRTHATVSWKRNHNSSSVIIVLALPLCELTCRELQVWLDYLLTIANYLLEVRKLASLDTLLYRKFLDQPNSEMPPLAIRIADCAWIDAGLLALKRAYRRG